MGIKLYVLDLGSMRMDSNLVTSMSHIATADNPDCGNKMDRFPVPAYLIDTGEGYILYDTGCHPECMGESGRWPKQFQKQCPYDGDETTTVLNRLKQLRIHPDDINTVILSHMHNDHAGCVEFFPGAKFIVHKDEFQAAVTAYATHDYMSSYIWKDMDCWTRKKMNWSFLENEDGDVKICKGVTIINLGAGHARGVLALQIELPHTGNIIITSDAVYCSDNYNQMREPGVVYDTVGWRRSAKRIKRLASEKKAQVWFGHDQNQFNELKKAPENFYD